MSWSAGLEYDEGRLGSAHCYGFKSRDEAIAWLQRAFVWELCWYLKPACWVREKQ